MAVDGTYQITVNVGGEKTGTVAIVSSGKTVWFTLKAPVLGTIDAQGNLVDEDTFTVSGKVRVLLKRVNYTVTGRVVDDTLIAVCETNLGTMDVVGTRIE